MYLSESFRIWRKRRYLTAALLVLALAGSGAALSTLPRTYQANSSVILLASRAAASPYGGNPYLSFSPSLTLAADAVSRELMGPGTVLSLAARGFSASYTVALAPYTTTTTGSVLLVTVAGESHPVQPDPGRDALLRSQGDPQREPDRAVAGTRHSAGTAACPRDPDHRGRADHPAAASPGREAPGSGDARKSPRPRRPPAGQSAWPR